MEAGGHDALWLWRSLRWCSAVPAPARTRTFTISSPMAASKTGRPPPEMVSPIHPIDLAVRDLCLGLRTDAQRPAFRDDQNPCGSSCGQGLLQLDPRDHHRVRAPGQSYRLEAWVRTSGVAEAASVVVQLWSINNTLLGFESASASGLEAADQVDWRRLSVPFQVPEGADRIFIRAGMLAPENAGGTVWFDDVSAVRMAGP